MHINFRAPGNTAATGMTNPDSTTPKARGVAATTQHTPMTTVSGSDAQIISAAQAALKATTETDIRINDIRQAIQSGAIRFDAGALAASILRYHGKQD